MSAVRFVSNQTFRAGNPLKRPVKGSSWGGAIPKQGPPAPSSQLDRIGYHAQSGLALGLFGLSESSQIAQAHTSRLLSSEQLHLIYQRTPDVRAAIDGIVRRIATQDWAVVPKMEPDDERYEEALAIAEEVENWLKVPNADGETWQEVITASTTDLLKYDAGVIERALGNGGELEELVALRGCDVHPIVDERGRLSHYVQMPWTSMASAPVRTKFAVEQILYLRLFPNTEGPYGIPILESLVHEIIAILRTSEFFAQSIDLNEVPPGVLVLTGIAREAADNFKAEIETKSAQDWKMRFLASYDPGSVDAKWVEFRRAPRELQLSELASEIRRAIWRCFGVTPVEMGDTEDMPRATAQVQLDVSGSHLIVPILELLQAKWNVGILPYLLLPEELELVEFKFLTERDLSEEERLNRSRAINEAVKEGVMSRNEGRRMLQLPPDPDGDVLTVVSGGAVIPLARALEEPPEEPEEGGGGGFPGEEPDEPEEGEEDPDADTDPDAADEDRTTYLREPMPARARALPSPHEKAAARVRASKRPQARARRPLLTPVVRKAQRYKSGQRSITDEAAPSEWTDGHFEDTRTLQLEGLWDEVTGYHRDVLPLWEQARTAVITTLAAEYKEEGFDAEVRARVVSQLMTQLEQLSSSWSAATLPRYRAVAESARKKAGDWTGRTTGAANVRSQADAYQTRAMSYLTAEGGLLSDLRQKALEVLIAVTDVRSGDFYIAPRDQRLTQRGPALAPNASAGVVLATMAQIFDAQRYRIGNWAGKLIELAHEVLAREVEAGASSGQAMGITDANPGSSGSVEWYVEWASVGDGSSCQTCKEMGGKGYLKLADLRVMPGGGTECRANCRCVLVMWTKAEIDGGRAEFLGGGNTGKPL